MLERTCFIKAKKGIELTFDHLFVTYLGGLGPKGKTQHDGEIIVEKKERLWLPLSSNLDQKSIGRWQQEVMFKSFLYFTCVLSFETTTFRLEVCYAVKLPVYFAYITLYSTTDG